MNLFLKAKHWQLFILVMILYVIMMCLLIADSFAMIDLKNPNPYAMDYDAIAMKAFFQKPISFMYTMVVWLWMYAVGTSFRKKMSEELREDVFIFKIVMLVVIAYTLVFNFIVPLSVSSVTPEFVSLHTMLGNIPFISLLFCYYIIGRILKTQELQRKPSFSECIGNFFLVMLFPVGVWIFQPVINRMMEDKETV